MANEAYDDARAKQEGWSINQHASGHYAIQRTQTGQLASDVEALIYVQNRADQGFPMHRAAIALHGTPWD